MVRNWLRSWRRSWICACSALAVACICLLAPRSLQAADLPGEQRFDFYLPAEPLEAALQRFNAQSGAAAGMVGNLPAVRTRAVAGRYTALEALQRMLAGSGIEAVPTGAAAFRLQRVALAVTPPGAAATEELPQVVVTANKRSQRCSMCRSRSRWCRRCSSPAADRCRDRRCAGFRRRHQQYPPGLRSRTALHPPASRTAPSSGRARPR